MKVAIVSSPMVPVPPTSYGGTEQVIYYLIRGLKEAGHEPILLATGDSTVDCELIPIAPKALAFAKKRSDLSDYNKRVDTINRTIDKTLHKLVGKVDLIHSHGYDLVNMQHFPNLTTLHNSITLDCLQYYLQRKNLFFVSISQNQQEACPRLQYLGNAYNGEDPKDFPIVKQPEDYVCFLGRFDREKNPHLAIQLAINLGIKIKVAGKIDYLGEGYFEEEIEKYFAHPLVEYLGELGFKQKIDLLSKAKCNLHPTGFREPFGLTVLEAAYCGTPTLAIARGSMPELIEEGRTGLLVEDFVQGYHRVQDCFSMDREYIARRARLLFNYQTMTQQYLKAYQRVLEIFETRREHEDILSNLTVESKRSLQEIWTKSQQLAEDLNYK